MRVPVVEDGPAAAKDIKSVLAETGTVGFRRNPIVQIRSRR